MNRLGQEPELGAGVVRVPELVGGETAGQLAGLAEPLVLFGLWRRCIRNYRGLYLELLRLPLAAEGGPHDDQVLAGQRGGVDPAIGPLRSFIELNEGRRTPFSSEGPERAVLVGAGRIPKRQHRPLHQFDLLFSIPRQPGITLLHVPEAAGQAGLFLVDFFRASFLSNGRSHRDMEEHGNRKQDPH